MDGIMEKGSTQSTYPELLWAGTYHSLQVAFEAHQGMNSFAFSQPEDGDDDEDMPYMLSIQGNIGVVTIRGPLVNSSSPWNAIFGVSGYHDIREALVYAAGDERVHGILLDIHSGGGAVSGVSDTADLISSINADIKPVWAVTDGMMASAAYWLGSSAGKVFASNTSIVGSIGVISTHMEYSKMLREEGIGVTVMRAGEYKALANSFEPLSDKAKVQMQDQLNSAYKIFIDHVAQARGTTPEFADAHMGQGREFFGAKALDAGLIDGVMSFDRVYAAMNAKLLDSSSVTQNNDGKYIRGPGMTRKALSSTQIAAAASGVQLPEPTPETVTQTEGPAVAPAASAAAPAAPEPSSAPAPTAPSADLVAMLQSQLTAANDKVVQLTVEVTQLKTKVEAVQPQIDGLKAIAARSLSTMKVALGYPAMDANAMPVDALLAEHATTSDAFQKAFKVGGVSAITTEKPEDDSTSVNQSMQRARLQAVRFGR